MLRWIAGLTVSIGTALILLSPPTAPAQAIKAALESATLAKTAAPQWPLDLGYKPADLHPLTLAPSGCPFIEATISGVPISLMFDTGTAAGVVLTNSAPPVPYRVEGRGGELNADGTPRGESSRIRIEAISVLGQVFKNVAGSLSDWKMFSSSPFNGTIGLDFFLDRRVTLDYRALKVGVSAAPLPSNLDSRRFVSVDLIEPPQSQGHILYIHARVNHRDAIIYLDTGYNVSFIDPDFVQGLPAVERPGKFKTFRQAVPMEIGGQTFVLDDLRESPIRRGLGADRPVALTLGSDVLSRFIITIDLRARKLVFALGE